MTAPRLIGDEIVIRCTSHPDDVYVDDFYAEKSETVTLASKNGGKSWYRVPEERYDEQPETDAYPNRKAYLDTRESFSPDLDRERREKLEEAGLGDLADKGWGGWTLFAESMSEKLKAMGYDVFDQHPAIPVGQVAVLSRDIFGKWSDDAGKTWNDSKVELPTFAHGPVHNNQVQLADGTRLWFCYGIGLHGKGRHNFVLRSADHGKSWKTIQIESDAEWFLSEASPLVLPDGRVLLLIRCDAGDNIAHVHVSHSDDKGQTWSPARPTKMRGAPLGAISLKSGAVLCTYAYRWFPGGIRGCLSRDGGLTWDTDHEKILRDDIINSCWISPCGAQSVQLNDGTIFTAFTLQKADRLREGDTAGSDVFRVTGSHNGRFHCYLAGCRYTEDYVHPLR
jgi:hypothetical protein